MALLVIGAHRDARTVLVRSLIGRGHSVIGTTVTEQTRPEVEVLGAGSALADVLDPGPIAAVVRRAGPHAIVNLATRIPRGGLRPPRDMRETNRIRREGTRNLLAASTKTGVRRYVGESMIFY